MQQNKNDWFNDSDFWEHFAPIMFDDAHWAEVSAVADAVTRIARLNLYNNSLENDKKTLPPRLLDLCCGIGRLSTEFARMGYSVTGVDITESYLKTAREDAENENLSNIEYIKSDVRNFKKPDFYDVAVNLYISFGFFDNPKDDLLFVRNAYESIKPGGCFIIETQGKEIYVRDFIEGEWFERAGCKVLTRYKVIDSWDRLQNTWILIKDGKQFEKTFTQRLYCATELRTIMQEAGFKTVEIYGNWEECEYDINADKLIAVGRK